MSVSERLGGRSSPACALGWRFSQPRESPRGSHLPENQAQGWFAPAIDTGTFSDNSDEFLARVSWSKFLTGSTEVLQKATRAAKRHRGLWQFECVAASQKEFHSDRTSASHHCCIGRNSGAGPSQYDVRASRRPLGGKAIRQKRRATPSTRLNGHSTVASLTL